MTIKVKLRTKPISGDRRSLYLDFYPAISHPETGKPTRREFLGLYIFDKPKSINDKQHNKDNLEIAGKILNKRSYQLNDPESYSDEVKEKRKIKEIGERDFVEYFLKLTDKRKTSNYNTWVSTYQYLKKFTNGNLKFSELNEPFCKNFKDYLSSTSTNRSINAKLSHNSVVAYFNKLKSALKQAYIDGYLQTDLNSKVAAGKQAETRKNFLTIEELNSLVKTECTIPVLKQAAIFSALTGLRFIDIKNLVWSEIEFIKNNGYFLKFTQQKTEGVEMMPISEQAFNLLGERKEPEEKVFPDLKYSAWLNHHLLKWITKAGITKEITFHCFRHTYATLQLSLKTDIYTVSKMLGHRDLKTTEGYAKIIDPTKRAAANKIILDI